MKEFTPEELEAFNGKDGQPAYVVYEGNVYDVTESKLWKDGMHMRRHQAGRNLTSDIQAAPHGPDLLERYTQVGVLREERETGAAQPELPKLINVLLEKNPFFRRHPHPMTVHFPIVFMLSTPVFTVLYLITGMRAFETTAMHCLAGGILFTVVGIVTGVITWWYNYMGKMMKPIAIKLPLSIVMLIVSIVAFIWRLNDPSVLDHPAGINILYLILVLSLFPMVSILGWFGATMTFPIEKD
jgi:predicted heme/steroid binding protein/uncharacterized membrane protein